MTTILCSKNRGRSVMESLESRSYFSVDLTDSVSWVVPASFQVEPGKTVTAAVTVTNDSSGTANGPLTITVDLAASDLEYSNSRALGKSVQSELDSRTIVKPVHLKPGVAKTFRVAVKVPAGFTPGTYSALAEIDPSNTFSETNIANNTAVSLDTMTVLDPYPDLLGTWSGSYTILKGTDKGAVVAVTRTYTAETDTSGAFAGTGTNFYTTVPTSTFAISGTISTKGVYVGVAPDSGTVASKGKLNGDTISGTFVTSDESGKFSWTRTVD